MDHLKSLGPPCFHGSLLSWCLGHTFCCGMKDTESKTRAELLTSSHFTGGKLPLYHIRKHHHLLLWFYSSYSSHNSPRPPLYSWQVPSGISPNPSGITFPISVGTFVILKRSSLPEWIRALDFVYIEDFTGASTCHPQWFSVAAGQVHKCFTKYWTTQTSELQISKAASSQRKQNLGNNRIQHRLKFLVPKDNP